SSITRRANRQVRLKADTTDRSRSVRLQRDGRYSRCSACGVTHVAARLGRYKDIAWFLAKYARSDVLAQADELDHDDRTQPDASALADDLKALGPTFIKLGQALSTRADLIPARYLPALAELQDNVEPVPFPDIEAVVQDELGIRMSKAFDGFSESP